MSVKKILMVDLAEDTELFLHLGRAMLSRSELAIHTAKSGTEALEKALRLQPDLVLLDLNMPDLDGDEVCRRLKADDTTFHIPVIMLATGGDGEARNRCLASGCDDLVAKPLKDDALTRAVEKHLAIRSRRHSRARVEIPCTVDMADGRIETTIRSLSPDGMFLKIDPPPIPGTRLTVNFTLPGTGSEIRISGLARWHRKLTQEMPTGSGFEFDEIEPDTFDLIKEHVDRVLGGST